MVLISETIQKSRESSLVEIIEAMAQLLEIEKEVISKSEEKTIEDEVKVVSKNDDLEAEVEDIKSDEDTSIEIEYDSIEEELLLKKAYESAQLDYVKLWYGTNENPASFSAEFEDDYWTFTTASAQIVEADMISDMQAYDAFHEIQMAAATGQHTSVNFDQRRRMDLWIKFNPALFGVFQTLYTHTSDVNYGL